MLDLPEHDLTASGYIEGVEQPSQMQAAVVRDLVNMAQSLAQSLRVYDKVMNDQ